MKWKSTTIDDLFTISPGKRLEKRNMVKGNRPFIGASDSNNGVTAFVGNMNESVDRNVLGINYNGSICETFYHPYECIFTDDVKRLHLKDVEDCEQLLLFMGTAIRQQKCKYEYAYKFNEQRMKRQVIMFPANNDGRPEWDYMSSYVDTKKDELIERYETYAKKQVSCLEYHEVPPLDAVKWAPIPISKIFDFERGRENNMATLGDGDIPLVSARNVNNGLKGFVDTPKQTIKGNCISLNNDGDGGAGLAYYQPYEMALDTHVTALIPKESINKWQMLFIAKCLSGLHGFFGHGLSISSKRARKIRIMLPVGADGCPDYDYMGQYAMNMMLRKYEQYLQYLEKKG